MLYYLVPCPSVTPFWTSIIVRVVWLPCHWIELYLGGSMERRHGLAKVKVFSFLIIKEVGASELAISWS